MAVGAVTAAALKAYTKSPYREYYSDAVHRKQR